jgi:2-oxoglutarate dehydrogenase E2 component (dihydrolipoamide succinyltransferase)
LTTFNEIDMKPIMDLRTRYRDEFEKKHGVKLGFMSIFVKAAINALQENPAVNAEIYGDEIIYRNYYDIGIAVGGAQGLVVPVMRDADKKNFAEIEAGISDFGQRARDGKLSMKELTGGTFTITNGGIFGSMLSTPILNPPQSGILGMHNIVKRPVVVDDEIVIRPMMYVALSYDHRVVDGREAVTFLVRIKQAIEDPERLLIGV